MHGVVDLATDVEALVLDPVFRDTPVEADADALPCPVEWHDGFRLDLATVRAHPDYRGAHIVDVAEEIAVDGHLDPAVIGAAVATGRHDLAGPQEGLAPPRALRSPGLTRLPRGRQPPLGR